MQSRVRLRTAPTERESMVQLEKYLQSSLHLIEYLEEKKNPDNESLTNKLYGNCLHLVTVREKEEFKEHDSLLVYRLWVAKMKLKRDRLASRTLDIEKLTYVIEYIDKVHQKYLPQKMACLVECFCQSVTYQIQSHLLQRLLEKFKEVGNAVSNTFGNSKDNIELLTLRVIAFAKSLDLAKFGQDLLILNMFFFKVIEISIHKGKTETSIMDELNHQIQLLHTMGFASEVIQKSQNLLEILIEATVTQSNLWPMLKEKGKDDSPGRKSILGKRRYFLKLQKKDEEQIKRALENQQLNLEYKDYHSMTQFDIDEIIKQKKLISQKQNFFQSVEENLITKWPSEKRRLAIETQSYRQSLTTIKKVYGTDAGGITLKDSTSKRKIDMIVHKSKSKESNHLQPNFYIKQDYKPSSNNQLPLPASRRSEVAGRGSKQLSQDVSQDFNSRGPRPSTGSTHNKTHRVRGTTQTYGQSEFLLLDSTKNSHGDQFYIK
jgi:hypothetical protein